LVVDDNATSRRILEELLLGWRMRPTVVADAAAALRELRGAAAAGAPFPVVLIDAVMPETDGFTLAAQIRQSADLAGPLVMMLSSADHPRDAERCRALDVAGHLIKPIKPSELLDIVLNAMGAPRPAPLGT